MTGSKFYAIPPSTEDFYRATSATLATTLAIAASGEMALMPFCPLSLETASALRRDPEEAMKLLTQTSSASVFLEAGEAQVSRCVFEFMKAVLVVLGIAEVLGEKLDDLAQEFERHLSQSIRDLKDAFLKSDWGKVVNVSRKSLDFLKSKTARDIFERVAGKAGLKAVLKQLGKRAVPIVGTVFLGD